MADILIKNMEMPSCCGNCEFNQFHEGNPWTTWYTCMFLNKDTDNVGNNRLADCPLVALPSHGDLIDRDKLYKDTEGIGDYCYDPSFVELCDALYDAPVIVEATE